MPRKYLRRYLPPASRLRQHWLLKRLGHRILHPRLWHLNRRSVSGATGLGLFVAFVPLPFQFILAGLGALWFRVNLPLAVTLIFITNPLTMGPAFYACYRVGTWILGRPEQGLGQHYTPTLAWLIQQLSRIWAPLLTGSLVIATLSGVLGYALVQLAWRGYIIHRRGPLARALANRRLQTPSSGGL